MIIASMLDAGLPLDSLEAELRQLSMTGFSLSIERLHGPMPALRFVVYAPGGESHRHCPGEIVHGWSARALQAILAASTLSEAVKSTAGRILHRLAEADAVVRGIELADVRYDGPSAIDTMVDVVGACIAIELLGISQVYLSLIHI